MSDAERKEPGLATGAAASPDQGWFVAAEGLQHGPVSAAQAWRVATGQPDNTPVHVWHPTLPTWRTLTTGVPAPAPAASPAAPASEAPAAPPAPVSAEKIGLDLDTLRFGNALIIAALAYAIAPIFVLGAAIVRDIQDTTLTLVFVAIVACLGWWLFLEQGGVRLEHGEVSFPVRLALWPYPAFMRRRLRVNEISGFECWAHGRFLHWFRLHVGRRSSQILLDNSLHREVLKLALERRLPQLPTPA